MRSNKTDLKGWARQGKGKEAILFIMFDPEAYIVRLRDELIPIRISELKRKV